MSTELDKAREAPEMTPDRLNEIRALLIGATPGPWRWFGNTNVHSLYLATVHHGRRFVMQFERWGMRDAAPLFQVKTPNGHGVMVRADELVRYEVSYRKDVDGIDHPDARLIEAAPSAIADLLTEVDRLTAALAEAEATIANEHGDGPAPAEGWQWITTSSMQGMWRRETNDNDQMVQRLVGRGWYWTDWEHPFHPDNVRPTARAAMRAATTATVTE